MRTAQEIIDQTNAIAAIIYLGMGIYHPKGLNFTQKQLTGIRMKLIAGILHVKYKS